MFFKIIDSATNEEIIVWFNAELSRAESALFPRMLKEEKAKGEGDLAWQAEGALNQFEEEAGVHGTIVTPADTIRI